MTGSDWLACDDPVAMLAFVSDKISPRRLRLFACRACRIMAGIDSPDDLAEFAAMEDACDDPTLLPCGWSYKWWCAGVNWRSDLAESLPYAGDRSGGVAALLREIVGNPWRPVTLPQERCWDCMGCGSANFPVRRPIARPCPSCKGAGKQPCPWLTPDVMALAAAAYAERPGRECPTCGGKRKVHWNSGPYESSWDDCEACRGTGRVDDGALDPFRFALLADALEEAGADDATLLDHLRGYEVVPAASGGVVQALVRVPKRSACVRGCWAIDCVLGRE